MMDFSLPPEIEALRLKVRAFVEAHVMPLEADRANYDEHENIRLDVLMPLREKARTQGLWAPQMPKARGGLGLPMVGWAAFYEEANRSIFGPLAFNCAAPDDGNMNVLNKVLKTDAQKDQVAAAHHRRASAHPS
jgi:acyl-CoA dehydrogenase